MEDIIWYLHKFLSPRQYSLLNKKCRKTYLEQKGVVIHHSFPKIRYTKQQSEFLSRQKIELIFDSGLDLNIRAFDDEYREKIFANIVSVKITETGNIDKILKLLKIFKNVGSISGIFHFRSYSDHLILGELDEKEIHDFRKTIKLIQKLGLKICVYSSNIDKYEEYLDLVEMIIMDKNIKYPTVLKELKTLQNVFEVPDIIAPKLESVFVGNIFIACDMVRKFSSITELRFYTPVYFRDNPTFKGAYNYLKDYEFTLFSETKHLSAILKLTSSEKVKRSIWLIDPDNLSTEMLYSMEKSFLLINKKNISIT